MALTVSYHRRHHRNGLGILDRARTADAYMPITRTYTDAGGSPDDHDLPPQARVRQARDRIISNVDFLQSNYNGMQIELQKRMSNRWQMLAGLASRSIAASTTTALTRPPTSATRTCRSTATTVWSSRVCPGRSRCRAATCCRGT